jgi:predicted dehydrogenase
MALSVAECDRMLTACASNIVRLGIAYYRRFYPVIERIKTLLAAGEIGRPVIAQINAFEWFAPEPSHPRRWLLEKNLSGGGPMFDFGCHRIDLLLDLFGPVKEIKGLASADILAREVEDTATALLHFASGVQATLTVTHAAREPQDTLTIYGTGGSIRCEALNSGAVTINGAEGERTESHPHHANVHQPLIDEFAQAVAESREPRVNGLVGRETARQIEAIYADAAGRSGRGQVPGAGCRI